MDEWMNDSLPPLDGLVDIHAIRLVEHTHTHINQPANETAELAF